MRVVSFLRAPLFAASVLLISMMFFPWLFFSDAFQTDSELTISDVVQADEPLLMNRSLVDFRQFLGEGNGQRVFDSWGLIYPQSEKVSVDAFGSRALPAEELNAGIDFLTRNRTSLALTPLGRNYNGYMRGVKRGRADVDSIPNNELDRLLYGLTRYNRAVASLQLAETNSRGTTRPYPLLREALYDLRRSVGAFENMGDVNNDAFEYWGPDRQAWEGVALAQRHGGLSMHQVYANLATAYLRIGGEDGYPYRTVSYLRREQRKYSFGDNAKLSPIVSNLIDICLKNGDQTPMEMFRLVQALHNLEAAGRGAGADDAGLAVFNYMIGVLLEHLADYEQSGITRNDAIEFFRVAARLADTNRSAGYLAAKEEILNLLAARRYDEAAIQLRRIDIGETEVAISGPDRPFGLLFIDMAQYRHLAAGDLDLALSHFERRVVKMEDQVINAEHQRIAAILGRSFFQDLAKRLRQRPPHEIGGLIESLEQNESLQRIEPMAEAYRDYLRGAFLLNPSVQTNLWLRSNPGRALWLRIGSFLLFGLVAFYLWWVFKSHQRIARQIIESSY